jgi:hypothetical protein
MMAQGHQYQPDPSHGHPPSAFSTTPRTGGVIFDAISDPPRVNYGQHPFEWAEHFTDPTFLISPSEHRVGNFLNPATPNVVQPTMPHRPQINIPPPHTFISGPFEPQSRQPAQVEQSPDKQGFINYDASSSLFTDSYVTDQLLYFPHSPYQQVVKPSAVDPGSSNGVFSFHSDQAMMIDPFPVQQHFLQPPQSNMAMQPNCIPIKNDPDFKTQTDGPAFAAAFSIPLPPDSSSQSVDGDGDGLDEVDELLKEWTTVF